MPQREESGSRAHARPVVVVEGPNGAGKSTVAGHLAAHLGGEVARYSEEFLAFRAAADVDRLPAVPRLSYYLGAAAELSSHLEGRRTAQVCDRYFASPLALLVAEGAMREEELMEITRPMLDRVVAPDVTLLLTAHRDELRRRIRERHRTRTSASLRQTMARDEFVARWTDALRLVTSMRPPVVEIDTTMLTIDEMCRAAETAVQDVLADR